MSGIGTRWRVGKPGGTPLTAAALNMMESEHKIFIQDLVCLALARQPDLLLFGDLTYDTNGAIISADVQWPTGETGAYVAVADPSISGAVRSYTLTRGGFTYTQPNMTRAANGAITNRPAITVTD